MTIKALFPTVRPTLNLDFAKTKALDPRITFTRASTATFVGADGLIKTAASGAARFDHNPATGESLGLLVEEARTNVCTYSIIDATNWATYNGSTITANAATAPDGTNTAALVTFPAVDTRIFRSLSVGAGTVTQTVWLKAVTGTITVRVGNPSDYGDVQHTVGTTWTRVTYSTASGSNSFGIYGSNPSTAASFYAWGAQMELGSFPTSYIPTTTATVTRAADSASISGSNFSSWFNQSTGTIYIETQAFGKLNVLSFSTGPNDYFNAQYSLGSNSENYGVTVVRNSPTLAYLSIWNAGYWTDSKIMAKYAISYSPPYWSASYQNNPPLSANVVGTTRSDYSHFWIGQTHGAGNGALHKIRRITYYPVQLPDAQLQALTAT